MEKIKPKLFSVIKNYTFKQFISDLNAGVIVAIIALPLSIALSIASGATPERGLYSAIIAGFIAALLSGSRVQITGPTAASSTIVASIIAMEGFDGLIIATIIAGILLLLMGFLRFGNLIKYIPYTITTGFTSGIAVIIAIGQIKDFLGLEYPVATEVAVKTGDKVKLIAQYFQTIQWEAILVGAISLLILLVWPKISKKIPGSLVAIIVGILLVQFTPIRTNTIGDLYTISNKLPPFHLPAITLESVVHLFPSGFTIAFLAAISSLLSCVVSDSLVNSRHRSNMELVAQGAGNIVTALFGGIPATGAIARTISNAKNGGKTPIAGMIHAVVLALIFVFLIPYATYIPMPTIAAILLVVAYHMSEWREFISLTKHSTRGDIMVLITTFVMTICFDLVLAIEVGIVLSAILFMRKMSEVTEIQSWKYADDDNDPDSISLRKVERDTMVYEISGPLFFGAADKILNISLDQDSKYIILRMRSVNAMDATAVHHMRHFVQKCKEQEITLIISHMNPQPLMVMKKAGLYDMIGETYFVTHIDDALRLTDGLRKDNNSNSAS